MASRLRTDLQKAYDGTSSGESPFMKLSPELHHKIYEIALEPRAVFTFHDRNFKKPITICRNDLHRWYTRDKYRIVSYRLHVSLPLLLVCKQVAQAVKSAINSLEETIRFSFEHENVIPKPSTHFLSICASSLFVLDVSGSFPKQLLNNSLDPIRFAVRSIVITNGSLYADDGASRKLWSKEPGSLHWTPFTRALLRMPSLEEVAVFIPGEHESDWYCDYAADELCELLELGRLQRVRFYYTDRNKNFEFCRFMEAAKRPKRGTNYTNVEELREQMELEKKLPDRLRATRESTIDSEFLRRWGTSWAGACTVFLLERTSGSELSENARTRFIVSESSDSDNSEFEGVGIHEFDSENE